jgi:hypothetical protein
MAKVESRMKSIGPKEVLAVLQRYQHRSQYAALKKSCEAAAVEWRWATSLMLPELPHDDIVRGFKPPRWANKQTRHGSLHGLDAAGRIRCIRSGERTRPAAQFYEQFLIHEDGGFWCIYFSNDRRKSPLKVKWYELDAGRWLRSLEIGAYGVREYLLHWQAGRFVGYADRSWQGVSAGNAGAASRAKLRDKDAEQTVYSYSYAADGELERVTATTELDEGRPPWVEVKYQRLPPGASLKSLLREAEELLVADIPKTLRAAKVRETVYALLVQFTGVDTDLTGYPPPLFLPTEDLRRRLLETRGKEAAWYLWAVPEWESDPGAVRVVCKSPALDEKLHLIFQLTVVQASPTRYGPVRKMFQRVCASLNALAWKGILRTTDDFVVFPFDTHGELNSTTDVKASVPVEKLRLLMNRGHIWRMKLG